MVCLCSIKVDSAAYDGKDKFRPVDVNQIPEIFTLLSTHVLGNYERIKTWQGKADVVSDLLYEGAGSQRVFKEQTNGTGPSPKSLRNRHYRTIEFALDVEKDFLYVNLYAEKPIECTDLESGRDLGAKGIPNSGVFIVTPEYYSYSRNNTMLNGVVMSRAGFKELRSTCKMPHPFDPRGSLSQPRDLVRRSFPIILKRIHKQGNKVEERTADGITEYRITIEPLRMSGDPNDSNYLVMSSTFSSDKGFNVILQETTINGDRLFQRCTWDYDAIDGIYVLTKTSVQNYEWETGKPTYIATDIFKNVKINQPISSEVFSYKNLGLKNGDKYIDKIESKEFEYKDDNLVELTKKSAEEGQK
jgi:predicted transcriptional regulator